MIGVADKQMAARKMELNTWPSENYTYSNKITILTCDQKESVLWATSL